MAPRIRNISPDEFRRLFKAPEIQSPGLTVSDAINLTNALEQKRSNELKQQQQMAEIERKIAEAEAEARQNEQITSGLTQPITSEIESFQTDLQAALQQATGSDIAQPTGQQVPGLGEVASARPELIEDTPEAAQLEAQAESQIAPLETQRDLIAGLVGRGKIDQAREIVEREQNLLDARKEKETDFEFQARLENLKQLNRLELEKLRQQKDDGKQTKLQTAKKGLHSIVKEVAGKFNQLAKKGEVVDVNQSLLENVAARVKASAPGQFVAGTLGTEAQSIRNNIEMSRPLLVNMIRQASEMGARGIDSEKELQFYLQAASDPTRDLQANLAALQRLDEVYGLGKYKAPKGAGDKLEAEFKAQNPRAAKISAAREWLQNNPNHPKAEAVRNVIEQEQAKINQFLQAQEEQ